MKKIIGLGLIATFLLLFNACIEDEGNYNYSAYKTVGISGVGNVNAFVGEQITFDPVVDYNGMEEGDFEYGWYWEGDTLSTSKSFTHKFDEVGQILNAVFAVRHKEGYMTTVLFSINVTAAYETGWIILSNSNGNSVLHYARPEQYTEGGVTYKYKPYYDMYGMFSDQPMGTGPYGMAMNYRGDEDQITVLQTGGPGPVIISGTNFREVMYDGRILTVNREFLGGSYPSGFIPDVASYGQRCDYLIDNTQGTLYFKYDRQLVFQTCQYISTPALQNIRINKVVGTGRSGAILLYDEIRNGVVAGFDDMSSPGKFMTPSIAQAYIDNGFTKFTDLGDNKLIDILIYRPQSGTYSPSYVNVIRMASGEYRLQYYSLAVSSYYGKCDVVGESTGTYDENWNMIYLSPVETPFYESAGIVTDNSKFLVSDTPYILIGEGNKVYLYDSALHRITEFHEFAAGAAITRLVSDNTRKQMGVALDNGEFYVLDIAYDTAIRYSRSEVLFKMTGLDEIIDVEWKYGSRSKWEASM